MPASGCTHRRRRRDHGRVGVRPALKARRTRTLQQRFWPEYERTVERAEGQKEAGGGAVHEADALIQSVMRERGYPVDDFEQRAADVSVDHPQVVENSRAGHRLASGDTEAQRQAMVHDRALFDELVDDPADRPLARDEAPDPERARPSASHLGSRFWALPGPRTGQSGLTRRPIGDLGSEIPDPRPGDRE